MDQQTFMDRERINQRNETQANRNGPIKILLLGAAFSADLHMDGYARIPDRAKVVAICDKDKNRVEALAAKYGLSDFRVYTDYERAIRETACDLVDICLPNFLHCKPALLAFEKKRDVLCEKPLATTPADGQAMVDKARQYGCHLYYAEDWLFAPAIGKAVALVGEGAVGQVVYIRARECHSGSHSPYSRKISLCGGGSMIHLGIHPVGFLLALKQNAWTELMAMTSAGRSGNLIHTAMEGEDWSACMMRFADGTTAVIEANYVTSGGMEDVIDFYGTQGCLHVDLNFSGAVRCFSIPGVSYTVEKAEVTTGWSQPAVDEKYNLGYADEIAYFVECCAKGIDAKPGLRGADGLEALAVVHHIYESAKTGRRIVNPGITAGREE